MKSAVTEIEAAPALEALAHFEARRRFETDCWDVHASIAAGRQDFVLLDVRSPALFQKSHIPGAINLPHGKIIARKLSDWPMETLFVVYCAGPHCNGANKAAVSQRPGFLSSLIVIHRLDLAWPHADLKRAMTSARTGSVSVCAAPNSRPFIRFSAGCKIGSLASEGGCNAIARESVGA